MRRFQKVIFELTHQFLWSSNAVTRTAPHIRDTINVQQIWNYFVLASIPAWLIGSWNLGHQTNLAIADFQVETVEGWRAWVLVKIGLGFDASSIFDCFMHGLLYFVPVFLTALLTGAFWESVFASVRDKPVDQGLFYIAWFFALMMPASVPMLQVALGMTFGIVVGKLIFGGSGRYLINPPLLGVAFLTFSYPSLFLGEGAWVPLAGYDQPTVLELVTDEGGLGVVTAVGYSWEQLFMGDRPGAVGFVSSLGALIGAVFLVLGGVASWRIMLGSVIGMVAAVMLFNALDPANDLFSVPWYWHFVLGGFTFGVVFLATDPVATPMTNPGRWGFGILVGALTILIRVANPGAYEGILYAILLACIFSPLIDFVVTERNIRRRRVRLEDVGHE